jgi:hypothetical protein
MVDEGRKKLGDATLATRRTLDDPAERDKNEFTQLRDTNKADVFFIIELTMAVMSNINVLSSLYSVGDPEPGGKHPYGGSRA